MIALVAAVLAAAVLSPQSSSGAENWPCGARPQPPLQAEAFWPGLRLDESWRSDPEVASLVSQTAPRSLPLEEAQARLAAFVKVRPASAPLLAAGLFETVSNDRAEIISGIYRFNTRQMQLSKRVEQDYADLEAAKGKAPSDVDGELQDRTDWDVRIFEDRQRMLPLICRQPDVLESRLHDLLISLPKTNSR